VKLSECNCYIHAVEEDRIWCHSSELEYEVPIHLIKDEDRKYIKEGAALRIENDLFIGFCTEVWTAEDMERTRRTI
jgi:hypothetical protein